MGSSGAEEMNFLDQGYAVPSKYPRPVGGTVEPYSVTEQRRGLIASVRTLWPQALSEEIHFLDSPAEPI